MKISELSKKRRYLYYAVLIILALGLVSIIGFQFGQELFHAFN